ncbi:uncharacterized protein LOC127869902 [Dreissena polymorpha]|uniref:uncharacterized protein LOC127869902 n=1 Tax=Dreissena polymorpha TaxID=45954 RepID=UPI002263E1EF|nr:uncharacterized protein LOC127869902 [Dreissena polymorpha]
MNPQLCMVSQNTNTIDVLEELTVKVEHLIRELSYIQRTVGDLARQVMLQQTFVEERIRSDGSSGLKQVRNIVNGDRIYHTADQSAFSVAGIHEHSSNTRTIGMGELNVVMNGVEFRTRHNDYRLAMPASDGTYHGQVDIPFPEVPEEVLSKETPEEQIEEMKLWFKAFKDQDYSVRDYRRYFKPVLCYLEGAWTTNTEELEEPFFSDRHFIDASSWFDLQEKVRFTSYTGGKDILENYAYLPTTIMNVVNGTPIYAQWNYRILCHPLQDDLPLKALEFVDDLSRRMRNQFTTAQLLDTRMARFRVRSQVPTNPDLIQPRSYDWGLLDDLMYQIPGKDNYAANLYDDGLGETLYHYNKGFDALVKLNTAFYNRAYRMHRKDASGNTVNHRGFSDPNLFAAQTTSEEVAAMSMESCQIIRKTEVCNRYTARYTWAIPLEIIYLTPLLAWNPYNIRHVGSFDADDIKDVENTADGLPRTGGLTPDEAFNGTHEKSFYRTPADLFASSTSVDAGSADTAKGVVGVLDQEGNVRKVVASGTRIIIPEIEGVGTVRTRYPIMPLHSDGEQTRKELEALKDMVMRMGTYGALFDETPITVHNVDDYTKEDPVHTLQVAPTTQDPPGLHSHTITVLQSEIDLMRTGKAVVFTTTTDNGHTHVLKVKMDSLGNFFMATCDGIFTCWDGHAKQLIFVS